MSGGRSELRVTEIRVYKSDGARLTIFLIGLASKDGVFVLAVSPGNKDVEPLVKEIANSFVLVPHELTPEELSRVSKAAKDGPKEH